jgi:deazaflavin-dependent oxidoreductase (nitroreductase family)
MAETGRPALSGRWIERQAMPMSTLSNAALPYGQRVAGLLQPLHRAFGAVNRLFVPALDAGLSPLLSNPATGYLMVLRTRGRRSGAIREAPLGYVILDGSVYCCAGFGATTAWYLNVLAEPAVEVVLPGRTLAGTAAPVTDQAEWARSYRALVGSMRVISRLTVGDITDLDDDVLLATHGAIPVIRIRPSGPQAVALESGPLDPGGWFWIVPSLGSLVVTFLLGRRLRRARRRSDRAMTVPRRG